MKASSQWASVGLWVGLVVFTSPVFGDVVGFFKFDDFPGDNAAFTDDTGQGLQGLLGFPFSDPSSVAGPSGNAGDFAVSFDGKGGLAVDDSSEVLNILEPPITLECWARSSSFRGVHLGLISYGVPGGGSRAGRGRGGYKLGVDPNGNILFTLFGVVDVFSNTPFPFDGQWHHVAATYSLDDGGVVYYLDGVETEFLPGTWDFRPPGTRHLDIGAQYTGLGRWDGDIDRVRISTTALTVDELDSDAANVKPLGSDTTVFFNFDEGAVPYQGQGVQPTGVAISTAEWVIDHPPHQTDGDPGKVNDTPSGGASDLALQFGGADMAVVDDPNGVLNVDGDWTLEAWVKIDISASGNRAVLFYYGHPGHGYSLSVNFAEGDKLQVTTLGIADMPSDTAVVDFDVWQHYAVVHRNGESITYYLDGVEAGSRAYTGGTNVATETFKLFIGAEWDGGLPFTGWIDRVRISNSALSPSEFDSDPNTPANIQAWDLY